MAIVNDDGVFDTTLAAETSKLYNSNYSSKPDVRDGPLVDEFQYMMLQLVAANSKFKNAPQSPNFEDRREEAYDGKIDPVTKDDLDRQDGVFINPADTVTDTIPKQLGVNILNDMIIKKENQPPTQRDDIKDLIESLKKKHPEHFE